MVSGTLHTPCRRQARSVGSFSGTLDCCRVSMVLVVIASPDGLSSSAVACGVTVLISGGTKVETPGTSWNILKATTPAPRINAQEQQTRIAIMTPTILGTEDEELLVCINSTLLKYFPY